MVAQQGQPYLGTALFRMLGSGCKEMAPSGQSTGPSSFFLEEGSHLQQRQEFVIFQAQDMLALQKLPVRFR